ncbi:MAG: DUF192 domain-containing protein [Candidatus Omnitrophota bacterium]
MAKRIVKVLNESKGTILAEKVEIAETWRSRSKGLLGRRGLGKGEGLLITPCNSIHTFFMKFPIDVLFLDKNMKIVKITPSMGPWRLSGSLRGYQVLEIEHGASNNMGISVGNSLKLVEL